MPPLEALPLEAPLPGAAVLGAREGAGGGRPPPTVGRWARGSRKTRAVGGLFPKQHSARAWPCFVVAVAALCTHCRRAVVGDVRLYERGVARKRSEGYINIPKKKVAVLGVMSQALHALPEAGPGPP